MDDVAKAVADFTGYDDIDKIVEDIRRVGLSSILNFSVEAKKALRIRKNWSNPQKTDRQKSKDIELEDKFTQMIERNGEQYDKETGTK